MLRFMIFSDLHADLLFDAKARVEALVERMETGGFAFAVSLGDLCRPTTADRSVIDRLRQTGIPFYPVIGNHDIEYSSEEAVCRFLNCARPYYSVLTEGIKCIFLNTCYMRHDGQEIPYRKDLYQKETDLYPILPTQQLRWLREELADTSLCYLVFSHHSLVNSWGNRGVQNRDEIQHLLTDRKVLLALNGHDHGDDLKIKNDIPYFRTCIHRLSISSRRVFCRPASLKNLEILPYVCDFLPCRTARSLAYPICAPVNTGSYHF